MKTELVISSTFYSVVIRLLNMTSKKYLIKVLIYFSFWQVKKCVHFALRTPRDRTLVAGAKAMELTLYSPGTFTKCIIEPFPCKLDTQVIKTRNISVTPPLRGLLKK